MRKTSNQTSIWRTRLPLAPLALALCALLGGCSMIPAYQRPAAPVAGQFPTLKADVAQTAGNKAAADLRWQDYFSDPALRRLIALALDNNRDLRVSVLNIEQARAALQIARANQLPAVNGVISGSHTPNTSGGTTSVYTGGLMVSAWEIDFFGRLQALKEQAQAQYLATAEARKAAQISLVATVANAWLALVADEELLDLSKRTLATREDSLKLTRLRFEQGSASELDLRQAESLVESARATLAQQVRQRAQDENALVLVLGQGLPDDARQALRQTRLNQATLPEVPVGLPSELLIKRPDIRQAEQSLIAANANIGAARAAFFPTISLTTGIGSASSSLSGLFKSGSWGYTMSPQLSVPIFNAGRTQAGVETAQAARDIAVAQYEKAIQSAFREVADALAGRDTLGDQLQAQQALVKATARQTELSDLRYRNGVASYLDWLDAQRSLFTAQQALVQTRLSQLQTQVTLYKVLGGGWTDTVVAAQPKPNP